MAVTAPTIPVVASQPEPRTWYGPRSTGRQSNTRTERARRCGVNRDPDAPIAESADLVVAGDLFEVGRALLAELAQRS
jgi:hypothetical protein